MSQHMVMKGFMKDGRQLVASRRTGILHAKLPDTIQRGLADVLGLRPKALRQSQNAFGTGQRLVHTRIANYQHPVRAVLLQSNARGCHHPFLFLSLGGLRQAPCHSLDFFCPPYIIQATAGVALHLPVQHLTPLLKQRRAKRNRQLVAILEGSDVHTGRHVPDDVAPLHALPTDAKARPWVAGCLVRRHGPSAYAAPDPEWTIPRLQPTAQLRFPSVDKRCTDPVRLHLVKQVLAMQLLRRLDDDGRRLPLNGCNMAHRVRLAV